MFNMAPTVALVKCASYDESEVEASVSKALNLVGGIDKYVKKGDRVLLKINLLSASAPEKAITTHPSVVKAMVKQVQSAGGIPVIGDSPGGPFNRKMLETAYQKSGMKAVADETGALLNYNTGSKKVSNPQGRLVKKLDILKLLDEVDVVITMPKLKTHTFTKFTGATKILFGLVPGLTKPAYHLKFSDIDLFSDMLLDILVYVKPSLSVMDGVVGIEGDGPGAQGEAKKVRVILASNDSVALDVVATTIIGMKPKDVPILRRAVERGMTSGDVSDIEVAGEKIDDVKVSYRHPSGSEGLMNTVISNKIIRRLLLKAVIPYPVANENCIRCGICKQNCPAGAITITDKARMNLSKCIRCYCCHELCPHKAVTLKRFI
jgi:uncharacterized protein (DUF362 family)/NAD-dependent dihydropyrimidine dehydrogenase PreA subunit